MGLPVNGDGEELCGVLHRFAYLINIVCFKDEVSKG